MNNDKYWVAHVLGKLYAVKHDNGNYSVTDFEGSEAECEQWIENNS